MNGYTDARMNLNEVCNWLNIRNYNDISDAIRNGFNIHTFTKDGMTRSMYGTVDMFRAMEYDIVTYTNIIPFSEAHVD